MYGLSKRYTYKHDCLQNENSFVWGESFKYECKYTFV